MKWLFYAGIGVVCLAIVDKWGQLGVIWPETSQKPQFRPSTVSKWHPSVRIRSKGSSKQVADAAVHYMEWYRSQWRAQ